MVDFIGQNEAQLGSASTRWDAARRQKENTDTALESGVCIGIVAALAAAARAFPPGFSTCVPQGVTYGQMIRVVVAYIERQPQQMHEDLRQLTILALHEAWPCD
jgi:hypothetical protein